MSLKRVAGKAFKPLRESRSTRKAIYGQMPTEQPADGGNPAPVKYKGGVIYTVWHQKRFRALCESGNRYSERSRAWGGTEPSLESWAACVHAIEEYA